jgi:formamidopyrimidine-DNA glycosylase
MPELPEVETVKRGLEMQIKGRVVNKLYLGKKRLRFPFPDNLEISLKGKKILGIDRRSKYLLVNVGKEYLVIHLGMSGRILFEEGNYKLQKHDHFILYFNDKTLLVFNDARRFGLIDLVSKNELENHKLFVHLGAEPLTKEFNGKYLQQKLTNKNIIRKTLKLLLKTLELLIIIKILYNYYVFTVKNLATL